MPPREALRFIRPFKGEALRFGSLSWRNEALHWERPFRKEALRAGKPVGGKRFPLFGPELVRIEKMLTR